MQSLKEELRVRAARNGRSMEAELRHPPSGQFARRGLPEPSGDVGNPRHALGAIARMERTGR
jgi:hypothetical protein